MSLDTTLIESLGDELFAALSERRTLAPLTDRHADITVDDAYRISLRFLARREAAGERVIGKKIGVTSKGAYSSPFHSATQAAATPVANTRSLSSAFAIIPSNSGTIGINRIESAVATRKYLIGPK